VSVDAFIPAAAMVSLELTLWDIPAEYARPLMSRTTFGSIVLQKALMFNDFVGSAPRGYTQLMELLSGLSTLRRKITMIQTQQPGIFITVSLRPSGAALG